MLDAMRPAAWRLLLFLAGLAPALPALSCEYPDEGTMPLHRALTRVKLLPATEAWHRERIKLGESVQYRLHLEDTRTVRGKCHWTVEAMAAGRLWRRFYVSPDGKSVLPAAP
jgi:hypothetical protein